MPTETIYSIERPDQLELLASPVRQDIIDSVAVMGPCSIAELALELGVAADSLYYHVRKLVEVGLLIEQGTRPTDRRDEAVYTLPASAVQLRYQPDDPTNVQLVSKIVASALRTAERDFRAGFSSEQATVSGDTRTLWGARAKMWLTEEEVREVNALLHRFHEIADRRRRPEAHHLCSLTWILAPIEPQPARRDAPGQTT